jgi:predicted nucleic acid-binding protein
MGRFSTLNLDDLVIGTAINLTQRHPLRGYDAVHLATALRLSEALTDEALEPLTFVSADDVLCQAAEAEGLMVENPNEH